MNSTTLRGALYGVTAASIWGGMYVVSEAVLRYISPFVLVAMRLFIGALLLALLLGVQRKLAIPRRDAFKLMAVGVLGFGISLSAQFIGTERASAINGSVITSASPAFILLFAWLILREPLTRLRIGAVGLATVGVLIVLDLSKFDMDSRLFQGNLALAFAALTWGLFSVLTRRASKTYATLPITCYGLIGGLLFCLPLAGAEISGKPIPPLDLNLVLGILYLGVISTAGAMWLWNRAFALVEAGAASLFFFAQPLVGVLLSNLLLKQPITPQLIVGGALIIGGVLLSMQEGRADIATKADIAVQAEQG